MLIVDEAVFQYCPHLFTRVAGGVRAVQLSGYADPVKEG